MAVNQVKYGNQIIIDITDSTVNANTLLAGYKAYGANGEKLTGTFEGQTKAVTASRSNQTVTPDSGKYLSQVTVNKYPDATGTYTYPENSMGGTYDMGATNNLRYVNASNVYAKGKADGKGTHAIINIQYSKGLNAYTRTITIKINDSTEKTFTTSCTIYGIYAETTDTFTYNNRTIKVVSSGAVERSHTLYFYIDDGYITQGVFSPSGSNGSFPINGNLKVGTFI